MSNPYRDLYDDEISELKAAVARLEQELNGDGTRGPDALKSVGLRACFELSQEHIALNNVEIDRLRTALQSIANNSCCSSCQEAKLMAQKALEGK